MLENARWVVDHADPTAKRLEELEKEVKALRQTVVEMRDALKKGK